MTRIGAILRMIFVAPAPDPTVARLLDRQDRHLARIAHARAQLERAGRAPIDTLADDL